MYSSPHPSVHLLSLLFLPPMRTHPITRENPSLLNPYTSTSTSTSTSGAGYISRLLSWEIFPDWAFFLFLTPFCRREGRKEGPGRRAKRAEGVCLNCSYKSSCFGTSRQLDRCRQNSRETWRQRDRQNDTPVCQQPPPYCSGTSFLFPSTLSPAHSRFRLWFWLWFLSRFPLFSLARDTL